MTQWNADGFAEFFHELWGWPPFAWQRDLARRVLERADNPWPEAIALPTAAGKTACLDVALFSLAVKAGGKNSIWLSDAPRRIFFVVDRRVIVDEAVERARTMARKLRSAEEGILFEVAERLRKLAHGDVPLMCFQLRGGMYRSDAWARSPLQPAIIASTVDQIGSRLLFRAYGRSAKAWPIQAGLAGNDSLILLDEAHCAQPFMETLQSIRKYREWAETPLASPFHVSILSATPPETKDVFRDTSKEPQTKGHPLGDRQLAAKPATLKESKAKGKSAIAVLAKDLAADAEALAEQRPVATVVFVNYVATARAVHELLAKKHGENAILLTGRMRPIDKDDTVSERLKHFDLSSSRAKARKLDAPVFVVATQTLEVGADLDFDLLVTECASLDALRQRFGRLNRMGRSIEARAVIRMRSDRAKKSEEDPVYGLSLGRTWEWLLEQAGEAAEIDMGIAALGKILPEGEALAELNAPTVHAPVMLPAHVDCWCQTNPEPVPTPEVSVFLHGPERASADVQVCWRADMDLSSAASREQSLDALAHCPPAAAETLSVPIWAFRRWMAEGETPMEAISDVEGGAADSRNGGSGNGRSGQTRRVVRWRGREEANVVFDPGGVRPGDVLVIPAAEAGWESLGDLPAVREGRPVLDWGDRAYAKARGKFLLRLHPAVVSEWPEFGLKERFAALAREAVSGMEEDPEALVDSLAEALEELAGDDDAPEWLRGMAEGLGRKEAALERLLILHPGGEGIIVRGRERIDVQALEYADETVDWFSDEDDASASGTANVSLTGHHFGLSLLALRFGVHSRIPFDLVKAVQLAARLHDMGKADPRFQALLRGGNLSAQGSLLAKSEDIPQGRSAYLRARKASGYPKGARHELLSVRLAESAPEALPEELELRDVVLHLIASHHGYCRPFAPVVDDPAPVEVSVKYRDWTLTATSDTGLERLDSGVSDRFWRLIRRYGWWGLAWLEAIFRLSDHRRSEEEEKRKRAGR